jgi:hypothetical protein
MRYTVCDNPSSIVLPFDGPDPGYILAESDGGLSNRLRVLAAYMFIGEYKFGGAHTVFVWDKNEACPGHFLSIFEPIENVIFATNSSRYVLDKNAKIVYENSYAVFNWIMQQNSIPKNKYNHLSWSQIERKMYSKYFPTREVMTKVNKFVVENNVCNNCSAMHIRSTDMDKILGAKKRSNLQHFFKFVESRISQNENEKIFLLTDDPETQQVFLNKYGDKILVYQLMESKKKQPQLFIKNNEDVKKFINITTFDTTLTTHRFSTLEHTLIDVLVAAHAKVFKPSAFSSLSDLVFMFESIGKKNRLWCNS